jgi:hypothetical protein
MLSRCRSIPMRAGLVAAVAAATCAFAIPARAAGPPQGGGGCHMVASPSSTGLFHMMAGSANGHGAESMVAMLSRFSPDPFCGL